MKFKLGVISLTLLGLQSAIAISAFANDAPVVDIQDQSQGSGAAATQAEQPSGDGWQQVNNNAPQNNSAQANNNGDGGGWQPASNSSTHSGSNNSGNAGSASAVTDNSGSVDQRVARLERQMSNYNQMNLPQEVSDLQQKIAQLQGQVEVDQHTIQTLTNQQKLYYQDTQQQIAQLQQNGGGKNTAVAANLSKNSASTDESEFEKKTDGSSTMVVHKKKGESLKDATQNIDTTSVTGGDSADTAPVVAKGKDIVNGQNLLAQNGTTLSDADLYDKAFRALSDKNFDGAQKGFHDYLANYPKGKFAVSAHFWLGEIGLMHQKYDSALKQFKVVVSDYPSSNKVPDAKLKIAMIHAATGKMEAARQEFTQIRKEYPGTTAAQLASIRLQQLANATSVSVQ